MDDYFHGEVINNFVGDKIMAWEFVVCQFLFITPTISCWGGFAGRAIGKMDWRDSMTFNICSAGWEMRFGLNTPDSSSARKSAFSLSVEARELSRR